MAAWVGNETLRPLGVAMGNVVSVTRVWRIHTKTPHVGRRQPMTSLPARPQYKGVPGKYVIHFFVWGLHPKYSTKPRGCSVSFATQGTMFTYITWDIPFQGNFELCPLGQWFSNFLHQVPPQKIFGFPSITIMTNIKMQYKWLPTAPGVCVCVCVCVCVHCCVCVHFGWVKCRAQIPSMSRHFQ